MGSVTDRIVMGVSRFILRNIFYSETLILILT